MLNLRCIIFPHEASDRVEVRELQFLGLCTLSWPHTFPSSLPPPVCAPISGRVQSNWPHGAPCLFVSAAWACGSNALVVGPRKSAGLFVSAPKISALLLFFAMTSLPLKLPSRGTQPRRFSTTFIRDAHHFLLFVYKQRSYLLSVYDYKSLVVFFFFSSPGFSDLFGLDPLHLVFANTVAARRPGSSVVL